MDFLKHVQHFGVVFVALGLATAGQLPKQDKPRWLSTNFKTLLTWDPDADKHSYDVEYAEYGEDWLSAPNCLGIKETECDLTNVLEIKTQYAARVKKTSTDGLDDVHSVYFIPYEESNITAMSFSLEAHGANGSVTLNITDPLTSIYRNGSLLTIRDVFQNDLKYRISYQKVGSTRTKEKDCGNNVAVVDNLEPHQGYCFSVAALITTSTSDFRLGAWSKQQCTSANRSFFQEGTKWLIPPLHEDAPKQ
ncbi:unnamed protein product [Lota lota]